MEGDSLAARAWDRVTTAGLGAIAPVPSDTWVAEPCVALAVTSSCLPTGDATFLADMLTILNLESLRLENGQKRGDANKPTCGEGKRKAYKKTLRGKKEGQETRSWQGKREQERRNRKEWTNLLVSGTSTLSGGPCGIYACIPIALKRLLSHESSKHRITCHERGCALYSAIERTYVLGHMLN